LSDAEVECGSMELLGSLLLDLGLAREAARVLADISALAHAAGLATQRWQAHVLRAQATLESEPGARMAAAAAAERLLRVLGEPAAPDPLGYRELAFGLLARCAAILSDGRSFQRALRRLQACDEGRCSPVHVRARLQVARGCWTQGAAQQALAQLRSAKCEAEAGGMSFLAWQAERLAGCMEGEDPGVPTALLQGLDAAYVASMSESPPVF